MTGIIRFKFKGNRLWAKRYNSKEQRQSFIDYANETGEVLYFTIKPDSQNRAKKRTLSGYTLAHRLLD